MPYQNCTLEKGPRGPHLSSEQWAAWAASSVQGDGGSYSFLVRQAFMEKMLPSTHWNNFSCWPA